MKNYWLIRSNPAGEPHEHIFKNQGIIGLGWGKLGDLSQYNFDDLKQLFYDNDYVTQNDNKQSLGRKVGFFKRFVNEMEIGDYVFMPIANNKIAIGQVDSNYSYKKVTDELNHIRKVHWIRDVPRNNFSKSLQKALSNQMTLISLNKYSDELSNIVRNITPMLLSKEIKSNFNASINNKEIFLSVNNEISKEELKDFFKSVLENF